MANEVNLPVNGKKTNLMLQVQCYYLCFLLRLMRSPSFTAKTFLALLFQKDKAKEKNKSKNRNF